MPGPSSSEADLVNRLTAEAANEGEALISAIRTAFCALVLARFLALGPAGKIVGEPFIVEVPLLTLATLASAWAWRRARRRYFAAAGLVASSVADGAVCFISLLSNVLWPDAAYRGLLRMPDAAAMLPVIFVSALRITPLAALAGTLAGGTSLGALIALDQQRNAAVLAYGSAEVTMMTILVVSVGAAAWAAAWRARSLVRHAARESVQLVRARQSLDALLREHHDVRTLLSTARLNLDMAKADPAACDANLAAIGSALANLTAFVDGVKGKAFAEVAVIEGLTPCGVAKAAKLAAQVVRHRFPRVDVEITVPHVAIAIVGGERSLSQVIFNLLCNACEGDGSHGATRVMLTAKASGAMLEMRFEDNGPGFISDHSIPSILGMPSSKPTGSGWGLMLVRDLVESSAGRLQWGDRPEGGAIVTVTLPLSPGS